MAIQTFDELVERQRDHECPGVGSQRICVRVVASARLPTRFGDYHVVGFENRLDGKEHAAFVHGQEALDGEAVPAPDPFRVPHR